MTIESYGPRASLSNSKLPPVLDNEMARQYTPRIRRHAAHYARKLPRHMAISDLVSAGFTGLVDACLKFDRERTHSFDAYLDHRIRGAMLDELRHLDPLTRDQRAFTRVQALAVNRLAHLFGRAPSESEVAVELGVSLAAMRDLTARVSENSARGAAGGECDLGDAPGDDIHRPDRLLEMREQRVRVNAAIDRLPQRHRYALQMYYGEEQTLRQIATTMGVTESRVSQIHSEAIAKLRTMLTAQ